MTLEVSTPAQRRGRPRSEKAREAVLAAAAELLLARGLGAVSMDDGRRTGRCEQGHHLPLVADQGDARSRCALPRVGRRPAGCFRYRLAARRPALTPSPLGTAGQQTAVRTRDRRARRRGADRPGLRLALPRSLRRAASRPGPAAPPARNRARRAADDHDVELALDLLYGPLYHRLLHGHAPLNDRFLRDLVDTVLAGLTARREETMPA